MKERRGTKTNYKEERRATQRLMTQDRAKAETKEENKNSELL